MFHSFSFKRCKLVTIISNRLIYVHGLPCQFVELTILFARAFSGRDI